MAKAILITASLLAASMATTRESVTAALLLLGFGLIGLSFILRPKEVLDTFSLPGPGKRTLLATIKRAGFLSCNVAAMNAKFTAIERFRSFRIASDKSLPVSLGWRLESGPVSSNCCAVSMVCRVRLAR